MSAWLSIEGIRRDYGGRAVFRDVWFGVERGEFVALIGHSGCGKTTILNILAGLEAPDAGTIVMDGREVGLSDALHRKPAELSGGIKQRVGIARALSVEPALLLMDEPFSALDALTRATLHDEVLRLVSDAGQTAFMITHDVDEAILLADRILLMTNGPDARVGEVVVNTLPRPRDRATIHRSAGHHALRTHIVDFLVTRSRTMAGARPEGWTGRHVPEVRPADTNLETTA